MRSQYTYGIKSMQSPTGNSRFIDKPFFTVDPTPMCYFYNVTFKEILRPALTGSSTFPEIPPAGLCPIPKGTYYVKDMAVDEDKIPFHLSRGLWKLEATIYRGNTLVGGYRVFAKVEENHYKE
ncbi:uncharacterized protein LOC129906538 [Episyrphus balteatus]|uniref:uncharacterized protein LOC129906538 n=1 Tax=Episyrphus balteatus TaxID=286459 RepID=UPI0024862ECE|nr:uncharacterized protein LOC129906538 [Episyrphus balteatus]